MGCWWFTDSLLLLLLLQACILQIWTLEFSKTSPTSSPPPNALHFCPTWCAVSLYVSMHYDGGCCLAFVYLLFSYCGLRSLLKVLPLALVGRQEGLYKRDYSHRWISCGSIMFCLPSPVNFLITTPDIDERISITPAKFKSTRWKNSRFKKYIYTKFTTAI